jgi:hypothetical protein
MTDAGKWLINTAKRNPEALLVLVAGCALLMRGGRSPYRAAEQTASGVSGSNAPWNISRTTEKASEIASDMQDRIADAGSSVTEQAGKMARTLSTQTSQIAGQAQSMLSSGFGQLLREQPLALVAAGLAAGAAVAALLPPTDLEERTLGGARDAISGMAGKAGENLIAAATDAGQRLTQGVAERATEGFKELAQDVAGQFTEKVTGATNKPAEGPGNVSSLSNRGI